jgi:hypothetical protein
MDIITTVIILIVVTVMIITVFYYCIGWKINLSPNATIISLIAVVVIVIGIIFLLSKTREVTEPRITIDKGKFIWLEQKDWLQKPIVPLSDNTLLGGIMFDDDRYDPKLDTLQKLYLGKRIQEKQAWLLRGTVNKNINFWNFTLFKMSDNPDKSLQQIGYSINNEMVKDSRNGDDIIIIVSPTYKLAEYIANQIHQKDYGKKMSDDRHVIFRYFPIPDFDASVNYTLLYEATRNAAGALPKFKCSRYTYWVDDPKEKNIFPFFPVERIKKIKTIADTTIDEYKTLGPDINIFDRQIENQIKDYKYKRVATFLPQHSMDYLYSSTDIMEVSPGDSITVGIIDHSSTGKCLYSELLYMDYDTFKIYDSKIISFYDPASIDKNGKIKIFINFVPEGITRIVVFERIVVDLSTHVGPDKETIIPCRVYNNGPNRQIHVHLTLDNPSQCYKNFK